MGYASSVKEILEPYIGAMNADTCVRGTALSLGKMSDELGPEDLQQLEGSVRRVLGPMVPGATLARIVDQIGEVR
jgi:hypothetical protein